MYPTAYRPTISLQPSSASFRYTSRTATQSTMSWEGLGKKRGFEVGSRQAAAANHAQFAEALFKPTRTARSILFTKQQREQVTELLLEVEGSIPQWLRGTYLRNGPGDFTGMKHLFDGYAMLQKVRVEDGRAFAMHRFLQSQAYKHKRDTGAMRWREFSTGVPHQGIATIVREVVENTMGLLGAKTGVTDNASINVLPHPEPRHAIALTETVPGAYVINIKTLETLRQVELAKSVPGVLTTAHPHATADGDIINVKNTIGGGYHVYKQERGSMEGKEIAYIPHRNGSSPGWIHDFALSANYAIVIEPPIYFNLLSILTGLETDYVFMDWKPEYPTRVHVVDIKTGSVTTKEAPAFFAFHYINAFENDDGTELYVDMAKFEDPTVLNQLKLSALLDFDAPDLVEGHPERMTIRLGDSGNIGSQFHEPTALQWRPLPFACPSFRAFALKKKEMSFGLREIGWRLSPYLINRSMHGICNGVKQDIRRLAADGSSYGCYCEFPTVSPLVNGVRYRFSYGVAVARPSNVANALAKWDHKEGTSKVWHNGNGGATGEPRFIPRPGAEDEDDGIVISICTDADGLSFCVFLDGKSFSEVARAKMPYGLTYGFHGHFFKHH